MVRVAVVTPPEGGFVSPLLPSAPDRQPSWWEWYHRCLGAVGAVDYFGLDDWSRVRDYDQVFVHEALEARMADLAVAVLEALRGANRSVTWVEPHQRSTFAASVFAPGFFEVVDTVLKYQLVHYDALCRALADPRNNLAPWAQYGHNGIESFYADRRLFGVPTSPETLAAHFCVDLGPRYGGRIRPLMRPFNLARAGSWYDGPPGRQRAILKEADVNMTTGDAAGMFLRGALAAALARCGLDVKIHWSPVRAAATADVCLALGPIHWDGSAWDVTRFDTLAVLPEDDRYVVWSDVFRPMESYLPVPGFGALTQAGGRILSGDAVQRACEQLEAGLADGAARERILEGQRAAHASLSDAWFVAGKLGLAVHRPAEDAQPAVDAKPSPPSAPRVAIATAAPVELGAMRSDDISVLIQGALSRDDLTEQVVESAARHLPGAEIVVSTWRGERDLDVPVDRRVESDDPGAAWQVHEEWPNNTNRLLVTTQSGLAATSRPYVLKLRTDTPLSGAQFAARFNEFPERAEELRLLSRRVWVINMYCWNPAQRPYGLFTVADTVQFGCREDMVDLWARPLSDEPALSTWFEWHARPVPDQCWWAAFRYSPEQVFWLGFLRKHAEVPFEHFQDSTPAATVLSELSLANNVVIVSPEEFGVETPRFAGRQQLEPGAVYTHAMWRDLYERYCGGSRAGLVRATLANVPG